MGESEDYKQGHLAGAIAGAIAERLDNHDRHFAAINGSLERIATELTTLNLNFQGLDDAIEANNEKVTATALALKEAATSTALALKEAAEAQRQQDEQSRNRSERSWVPWARVLGVLGAVTAVAGVLYQLFGS